MASPGCDHQWLPLAQCLMFPEYEGREFQDACLRVIADHGDEVALQIPESVASKLMRNVSRKLWRCLASRSRTKPLHLPDFLLFRFCTYCTLCRLCECDWVAVLRLLTKLSQPSVAVKLRTTRNVHDFFFSQRISNKKERRYDKFQPVTEKPALVSDSISVPLREISRSLSNTGSATNNYFLFRI